MLAAEGAIGALASHSSRRIPHCIRQAGADDVGPGGREGEGKENEARCAQATQVLYLGDECPVMRAYGGRLTDHECPITILQAPVVPYTLSCDRFALMLTTCYACLHADSCHPAKSAPSASRSPARVHSKGTQTVDPPAPALPLTVEAGCSAMISERVVAERYARRMGLFLGPMQVQEHKWWHHFSACMRMPRGGVNGTGSQACSFEYSVPGERALRVLVEGLPHRQRQVWDRGDWIASKSIDTYFATDVKSVDTYFQLHRRACLQHMGGFYRGSRLISPPNSAKHSVILSVAPPLLLEVCHRSGKRVEVVVSFKLTVFSDLDALTLPPHFRYATGMDTIFRARALNHLKALHLLAAPLSVNFCNLVSEHESQGSDSEEAWSESDEEGMGWTEPAVIYRHYSGRRRHASSEEDSDSASDAAKSDDLHAHGERPRTPHRASFPRQAHLPAP